MSRTATKSPKQAGVSADHRIILLFGKEHFRVAQATRDIEDSLRDRFGQIDIFTFDGATIDLATVLDELRSYSLMQSHKLVILDNADKFLKSKGDDDDDDDSEGDSGGGGGGRNYRPAMERYAENPVDHATLILRAETWRPGRIDKIIQKVGAVTKFAEESEASAATFCIARAREEYAITLERAAAALLVERLGTSLTRLESELGKLASLIDSGGTITEDHIRQTVGKSREEQAWDVQEAILTGRPAAAITKVRELIDISQAPRELIMWSMVDLVRKLHTAACLLAQGASPFEAKKQAKMWGPASDAMLESARRQSPRTLAHLLRRALRLDERSKTGLASSDATLEGLAVTLADMLK